MRLEQFDEEREAVFGEPLTERLAREAVYADRYDGAARANLFGKELDVEVGIEVRAMSTYKKNRIIV